MATFKITAVKQTHKYKALLDKGYLCVPFGIVDVNANRIQAQCFTGSGVTMAILDTGIVDRPDFNGRVIAHYNLSGKNELGGPHGTHVCGTAIAGGPLIGVATKAKVIDIQFLTPDGGSDINFAKAIDLAVSLGVDVINMSVGSPDKTKAMEDAIIRAYNAGIVLVAAAGNSGKNTISYPGALDQCISVANLNIVNDIIDETSSTNKYVDVCAPGDNVLSTVPGGYAIYSGTSMATPHVSGLACCYLQMIREAKPGLSKQEYRDLVRKMIEENVVDIGIPGRDDPSGLGEVRWQPSVPPHINYVEKSKDYYYIIRA